MRRWWNGVKIVHPNAVRRVVGGERPRQARDGGLGGVVLQIAAAGDDGTHEAVLTMAPPWLRRISGTAALAQKTQVKGS